MEQVAATEPVAQHLVRAKEAKHGTALEGFFSHPSSVLFTMSGYQQLQGERTCRRDANIFEESWAAWRACPSAPAFRALRKRVRAAAFCLRASPPSRAEACRRRRWRSLPTAATGCYSARKNDWLADSQKTVGGLGAR